MLELVREPDGSRRADRNAQTAENAASEVVEVFVEYPLRLAGRGVGLRPSNDLYRTVRTVVHAHAAGNALVVILRVVRHGEQRTEPLAVLPPAAVLRILLRHLRTAEIEHGDIHPLPQMPYPDEYVLYVIHDFHKATR